MTTREAFEEFYGNYQKPLVPDALAKNANGEYKHYFTRDALAIWQAALSQPNEPVLCKHGNNWNECQKSIMDCQCLLDASLAPPNLEAYKEPIEKLSFALGTRDAQIAELTAMNNELEVRNQTQLDLIIKQDNQRAELTDKCENMREALVKIRPLVQVSSESFGDNNRYISALKTLNKALEECK